MQEQTSVQTNNSAMSDMIDAMSAGYGVPATAAAVASSGTDGGFFGSLLSGLGSLFGQVAPAAANIYTLQNQGQLLKNQLASQQAAQQQAALLAQQQAAAAKSPAWLTPTVIWAAVVGGLVLLFVLIRRK